MKVLIIEDEPQAAQRLEALVKDLLPDSVVVGKIDTVKKSVSWLKDHRADLILMDIQLADGISFEIFEQCKIQDPVIFVTAYDAYALRAFKVNGVDYILKPVDREELGVALGKVRSRKPTTESGSSEMLANVSAALQTLMKKYKTRFVVKVGEHLKTVDVQNVRFFYTHDKATFCVTDDQRTTILDFTMDQLEGLLDPAQFFRINRKYIVRASAIQDIISYTNSRLRLVLKGSTDNDIVVARERVQEFRDWLDA